MELLNPTYQQSFHPPHVPFTVWEEASTDWYQAKEIQLEMKNLTSESDVVV